MFGYMCVCLYREGGWVHVYAYAHVACLRQLKVCVCSDWDHGELPADKAAEAAVRRYKEEDLHRGSAADGHVLQLPVPVDHL